MHKATLKCRFFLYTIPLFMDIKLNKHIKNRYSSRAYSKQMIEPDKINLLFEAARWAASSRNTQPWRFIYATRKNDKVWNMLFDCLIDFNKEWVQNAPFLILVLAQKIDPVTENTRKNVAYDIGLAMGNLSIQAESMGISVRNMGGFSVKKAQIAFNIPDNFEPIVMVAAGYPTDQSILNKELHIPVGNQRERKSIDQLVFSDNWQQLK